VASLIDMFDRYHEALYRYVRRRVGNNDDAQELSQEVFLRAHRSWTRFESSGRDAAWLFRIASNVLKNFKRDRGRVPDPSGKIDVESSPAPGIDPDASLDLERAMARLPEHEAEAFLLREAGGLGYAEIAAVTESTPDAVRNRIYRARVALKATLSPR
jgi:RNA polymerase sigma-70 factor (ECF subfamily)